jgi:hypothetical protein
MNVLKGSVYTLPWYSFTAYFLFFLGNFEYEKGATLKVLVSFAVGALSTIVFLAIFYSIFTELAVREFFSISKISKYALAQTNLGRADEVAIYAITIVRLILLSFPIKLATLCFQKVFKIKKPHVISAILNLGFLFVIAFTPLSFEWIHDFITRKLYIIYFIFSFIIPVLTLFLHGDRKNRIDDLKTNNIETTINASEFSHMDKDEAKQNAQQQNSDSSKQKKKYGKKAKENL